MNLHSNNLDTEMIDNIIEKSSKFLKSQNSKMLNILQKKFWDDIGL